MMTPVREIVFFSNHQGIVAVEGTVQLDNSRLGREGDLIPIVHDTVGPLRYRSAGTLQQCVPVRGEDVPPWKLKQSRMGLSRIEVFMSHMLLQEQMQAASSKGVLVLLG